MPDENKNQEKVERSAHAVKLSESEGECASAEACENKPSRLTAILFFGAEGE